MLKLIPSINSICDRVSSDIVCDAAIPLLHVWIVISRASAASEGRDRCAVLINLRMSFSLSSVCSKACSSDNDSFLASIAGISGLPQAGSARTLSLANEFSSAILIQDFRLDVDLPGRFRLFW